jgi:hypothetical protein
MVAEAWELGRLGEAEEGHVVEDMHEELVRVWIHKRRLHFFLVTVTLGRWQLFQRFVGSLHIIISRKTQREQKKVVNFLFLYFLPSHFNLLGKGLGNKSYSTTHFYVSYSYFSPRPESGLDALLN